MQAANSGANIIGSLLMPIQAAQVTETMHYGTRFFSNVNGFWTFASHPAVHKTLRW